MARPVVTVEAQPVVTGEEVEAGPGGGVVAPRSEEEVVVVHRRSEAHQLLVVVEALRLPEA